MSLSRRTLLKSLAGLAAVAVIPWKRGKEPASHTPPVPPSPKVTHSQHGTTYEATALRAFRAGDLAHLNIVRRTLSRITPYGDRLGWFTCVVLHDMAIWDTKPVLVAGYADILTHAYYEGDERDYGRFGDATARVFADAT